jgi:hypothetical protein
MNLPRRSGDVIVKSNDHLCQTNLPSSYRLTLRFLLLQRRQVVAEVLDALPHCNFVVLVHGAEDWPPNGHVG